MLSSYGERKIHEVLQYAEIPFKEEYSFPDLLGDKGWPLRFDFAVFDDDGDLDFLIEYQGIQHYQPKSKFGGWAGLRKQQYYDMKKRGEMNYLVRNQQYYKMIYCLLRLY